VIVNMHGRTTIKKKSKQISEKYLYMYIYIQTHTHTHTLIFSFTKYDHIIQQYGQRTNMKVSDYMCRN
jgi:hypothetical protein